MLRGTRWLVATGLVSTWRLAETASELLTVGGGGIWTGPAAGACGRGQENCRQTLRTAPAQELTGSAQASQYNWKGPRCGALGGLGNGKEGDSLSVSSARCR